MKFLVLLLMLFSAPVSAVQGRVLCAANSAWKHKEQVQRLRNDKTKHCSLSCVMAVECPASQAALLGYLKELWDLISPGHADRQDIVANEQGIRFSHQAQDYPECESLCLEVYPNP